jgi:nitrogen fixation protein FixH
MSDAATVSRKPRFRGSHALMILIGFFATIVAVDGFMIYKALSTFGGIETDDAYRKGVDYNKSIAKDAKQAQLGWSDEIKVVGSPQRLQVALRHGAGAIVGKRVVAAVGRGATDRYDVTINLVETSPGVYEAALPVAGGGTWLVDLSAYDDASSTEPVYQARRRTWIAP